MRNNNSPKKKETNEEKLAKLLENQAKAQQKQEAAEKKTAKINEQIEAVRRDIHNKEVARLDNICKEKNITYDDICDFLSSVTISFEEIVSAVNDHIVKHSNTAISGTSFSEKESSADDVSVTDGKTTEKAS